jgi:ankyrin repeat protein
LPLHCALRNRASNDIIMMLFHANPKATNIQNRTGKLPIDLYRGDNSEIRNMLTTLNQATNNLFQAIRINSYEEVVGILETHPEAIAVQDDDSWFPLHTALSCKPPKKLSQQYM